VVSRDHHDGSSVDARARRERGADGDDLHPEMTPSRRGSELQSDVARALERGRCSDATASDLITRLAVQPGTGFTRKGHHLLAGEELIEPRGPLGWI
jgi:hypothetical protein